MWWSLSSNMGQCSSWRQRSKGERYILLGCFWDIRVNMDQSEVNLDHIGWDMGWWRRGLEAEVLVHSLTFVVSFFSTLAFSVMYTSPFTHGKHISSYALLRWPPECIKYPHMPWFMSNVANNNPPFTLEVSCLGWKLYAHSTYKTPWGTVTMFEK